MKNEFLRALGRAFNSKGKNGENRLGQLIEHQIQDHHSPQWINSIRPANSDEQRHGFDWMVETDVGGIKIDVKTSGRTAIRKTLENLPRHREDIIVLDCNSHRSNQEIFAEFLRRVSQKRQHYLEKRNKSV